MQKPALIAVAVAFALGLIPWWFLYSQTYLSDAPTEEEARELQADLEANQIRVAELEQSLMAAEKRIEALSQVEKLYQELQSTNLRAQERLGSLSVQNANLERELNRLREQLAEMEDQSRSQPQGILGGQRGGGSAPSGSWILPPRQ